MSESRQARAAALLDAQRGVLEMIARGDPLRDVLAALCRIVEDQAERAVRASILLVDAHARQLRSGAAPSLPDHYNAAVDGIGIAVGVGTCADAAARSEVVVTSSIATDPAWDGLRHLPLELGLQAAWSMPVLGPDGRVLATFGTYFFEPRAPLEDERRLVGLLAQTAALAIERDRDDRALRATAARHRFLAEHAAATQPLVEPAAIMATSARLLAEHLDADRCAYAEVEDEHLFVITGDHPRGVPSIVGRWPVAAFGAACVRHMREGSAYIVEDVDTDPRLGSDDLPAYRATDIRAVVCMPLTKGGRFTAAMAVHQAQPRRWSSDEIELIGLVVARCWEALERARVTRTLRDSEARFRAIVETTPDCVKVVSADGILQQVNAAGLRMLEADAAAVLGRDVCTLVAPEWRERFRAFNHRVCAGAADTLVFEIEGLGGRRRWLETSAVPLPGGLPGRSLLAVSRDVSDRITSERALDESRARLDHAVRASGLGFWYCDLPFDTLVWDERTRQHLFVDADAQPSVDLFYSRVHPEDRARLQQATERSLAGQLPLDELYRTVDPRGGAIKWIRATGDVERDADGTPVQFAGVTMDVTTQTLDRQRLARLLDSEREQARLLGKVADAARTIHSSGSLDSVLQVVTEEARRVIGAHQAVTGVDGGSVSPQRIERSSLSDAYRERADALRSCDDRLYALVCRECRPLRLTRSEFEHHPELQGERAPPLHGCLAAPLVGRNGASLGMVQLIDKIDGGFTEADQSILVQLAQIAAVALENARLYDALREQDQRKNEFLATLAHELRNPLAPVRTGLEVMKVAPDTPHAARIRGMMERQVAHLVRMVDDLLDVSRITLGKVTLRRQQIDLRGVIDEAVETIRPLLAESGHRFTLDVPEGPLRLDADPTRLAQVIANLLGNACRYTPAGGLIRLEVAHDGADLVIRVCDNGIGIPHHMLGRVFDMFQQVGSPQERAPGGLGIGLTLVRRMVELHGGTVEARSDGIGCGSSFDVRLPLDGAELRALDRDRPPALDEHGDALRALIVDDNTDAAEALAMLIEMGGERIRLAHTGPAALAAASEFRPHVMFLDIGLPGMSGYEVARRLRADPALAQVVLVAVTGWGTDEDRRQVHAAGFDVHLVKPADADAISTVIATARRKVGRRGSSAALAG